MRTIRHGLVGALTLTLCLASFAGAQERHAVASSTIAQAVADRSAATAADRAAVRDALSRPEVRAIADKAGVNLGHLAATVDTLDATALARTADTARDVNAALVGGASTITISTTTIIIGLLIIILILVAD